MKRILLDYPDICHFEITTDTSKKEFKAVSVFKRIADIAAKVKKSFMISTFGPQHGKFLYDSAGHVWERKYKQTCVALLGVDADNLRKVVDCMNTIHSAPSKQARS